MSDDEEDAALEKLIEYADHDGLIDLSRMLKSLLYS